VQKSCVVPIAIGVITHLSQIWAFYGRESLRRVAAPQPSVAQKFWQYNAIAGAVPLARMQFSTESIDPNYAGILCRLPAYHLHWGGEELDTASTTPACVWSADSSLW
jgi:hypothetical protein